MESLKNINNDGMIVVEDTHASFMKNKGFKNPSKFSFINFTTLLIENLHRRNPILKKKLNLFSKKIHSIEYYDSITVVNIAKKNLSTAINLENNKKLRNYFDDYRFKKEKENLKNKNFLLNLIRVKVSKRSYLYRIYENFKIMKYRNIIKK
mgnify:FL=1